MQQLDFRTRRMEKSSSIRYRTQWSWPLPPRMLGLWFSKSVVACPRDFDILSLRFTLTFRVSRRPAHPPTPLLMHLSKNWVKFSLENYFRAVFLSTSDFRVFQRFLPWTRAWGADGGNSEAWGESVSSQNRRNTRITQKSEVDFFLIYQKRPENIFQ